MADQLRFVKPKSLLGISLACPDCKSRLVITRRAYERKAETGAALTVEQCPVCGNQRSDPWGTLQAVFATLSQCEARGIALVQVVEGEGSETPIDPADPFGFGLLGRKAEEGS